MATHIKIVVDKDFSDATGADTRKKIDLPPMEKLALLDSEGDVPMIHYYPVDLGGYSATTPLCCLIGDKVDSVPTPEDELDEDRTVTSLEQLAHVFEDLELEGYDICQQCESIFDAAELELDGAGVPYKLIILAKEPKF